MKKHIRHKHILLTEFLTQMAECVWCGSMGETKQLIKRYAEKADNHGQVRRASLPPRDPRLTTLN